MYAGPFLENRSYFNEHFTYISTDVAVVKHTVNKVLKTTDQL